MRGALALLLVAMVASCGFGTLAEQAQDIALEFSAEPVAAESGAESPSGEGDEAISGQIITFETGDEVCEVLPVEALFADDPEGMLFGGIEENAMGSSYIELPVVGINKKSFPDAILREYVKSTADLNSDGRLSKSEVDAVVVVDVSGKGISSFKGLQYFTKLEYLFCQDNKASSLDVKPFKDLRELECGGNRLKKLDVSICSALERLVCSGNRLTTLNLEGCKKLTYLDCSGNKLARLDLKSCKALKALDCSDNKLSKLNVGKCKSLKELTCKKNRIGSLDLGANAKLIRLDCRSNKLKSIDVSRNKALTVLACQGNGIKTIDIAKLPPDLRRLAGRDDLRNWNKKEHFWYASEDSLLFLPASTTVRNGKKLVYKKKSILNAIKIKSDRNSYPLLNDEQFANFRVVSTRGMGKNALYRSSDPLRTTYRRNKEAMAAMKKAGVRTTINMVEDLADAKKRSTFSGSYYATTNIWARHLLLNSILDREQDEDIADICRFMVDHEGPYLVHCAIGRDRTGFLCAVLECLMGASAKEVVDDYLVSYYNYNGIKTDSSNADYIATNRIKLQLAKTFGVGSITGKGVRLSECAESYLMNCSLSQKEIAALKKRLAKKY